MKRNIMLFLLLVMIPAIIAQASDPEEPDYSSPEYVNSMSPEDLASAIAQGKITDMSIVDDNRLAHALAKNPSISVRLDDPDLARAVNQDLSILSDPSVMDEIDSRARADVFILNDNPYIKREWFARKGIRDEGAQLESYDGSVVTTKGSEATTFNVYDHPGARVTAQGRLILADGTEISSAEVVKAPDGSINVYGGQTDLSGSSAADVHIQGGTAIVQGKIYAAWDGKPMHVIIGNGMYSVEGTGVVEADIASGLTTSAFAGKVTVFADGHRRFGENCIYTEYNDGIEAVTYSTKNEADYYLTLDGCTEGSQITCIERDVENSCAKIIAKGANDIMLQDHSYSILGLTVPIITDESTVAYFSPTGEGALISDGPIMIQGDQSNLPIIACGFVNENGESCYDFIGSSSQECGKDLGKLITQKSYQIYYAHQRAIDQYGVGTHFGNKAQYAKLMRPVSSGGQGFSHEQALLYVMLYEKADKSQLSKRSMLAEARNVGAKFSSTEEVLAYVSNRLADSNKDGRYDLSSAQALEETKQNRLLGSGIKDPLKTSCINTCEIVLDTAFDQAGRAKEYTPVEKEYKKTGGGIQMARVMQKLGWKVVFMSPDSVTPRWNDPEHISAINQVKSGKDYYGLHIDAVVADFNPTKTQLSVDQYDDVVAKKITSPTTQKLAKFNQLQNVASGGFIVCTGGRHTAMLIKDPDSGSLKVFENHWDENPTSRDVFEISDLQKYEWGSYVLVLPPDSDISKLSK